MTKSYFIFLMLLLVAFPAIAQISVCPRKSKHEGQLTIISDPVIDSLQAQRLEVLKDNPDISGYRIQIYFGNSRQDALKVRAEFMKNHPNIDAYITYEQPYFLINVGNYRSRFEAMPLFYKIKDNYDNIIIVPDKIAYPHLAQSKDNNQN